MAGIFGFMSSRSGRNAEQVVDHIARLLCHTSYCKVDNRAGDQCGLGVVHLGLLHDVEQPLVDEKTGIRFVLDGEAHDPDQIKARLIAQGVSISEMTSEPELFLKLFLLEGPEGFADISGSWAFAAHDERKGEFVIVTDRWGSRQVVYAAIPGGFAFFPEVKGVLAFPEFGCTIDPVAIADLIHFQHVFGNRTTIEGVSLVPPASALRWRDGRIEIQEYWRLSFPESFSVRTTGEWLEEYKPLLARAMDHAVRKPPGAGSTLSGGMDTRIMMAGIPHEHRSIHTYTFGERGCRDLKYARMVAGVLGTRHHELEIKPALFLEHLDAYNWFTDCMVSPRHCQIGALLPLIRKHSPVVLEGIPTGSLSFYMYPVPGFDVLAPSSEEEFLRHHVFGRREAIVKSLLPERLFHDPYIDAMREDPQPGYRESLGSGFPAFAPQRAWRTSITERLRRFSGTGGSFMRTQVEVRQPLSDYDLVTCMFEAPPSHYVDSGCVHELIHRLAPDLDHIPHHGTGMPANPSLLQTFWSWRRRQLKSRLSRWTGGRYRFRDERATIVTTDWLRGALKQKLTSTLLSKRVADRGIMNAGEVKRIVNDHMNGNDDYFSIIWTLMGIELWCRRFFDGEEAGE